MKLSSLMSSALIGGSLLLFSGCSTDPEAVADKIVKDALDEASIYSVWLVNSTTAQVTFRGVSAETETQPVASNHADSFVFNGGIDISYPNAPTIHYNKGYSGIYVAANCSPTKELHGIEDRNTLQVVNLTGAEFSAGTIQIRESNTSTNVLGTQYQDCKINTTSNFNHITFTRDTMISIDGGTQYKAIRQIDPSFTNLGEDMKYYLVAYNDGNLSFLSVAKVDFNQVYNTP